MMRTCWLLVLLCCGCASSRWLEAERPPSGKHSAPQSAELQAYAARLRAHLDAGRGRCAEARVRAEPELALQLFVHLEDEGLRLLVARAWPDAAEGALLLASETVRRRQPNLHQQLRTSLDEDARAGFVQLGDSVWAARAALAMHNTPAEGLALQRLQGAVRTAEGPQAAALCAALLQWRALDAALELDGKLELSGLRSAELAAWRLELVGLCLQRQQPLEALRLVASARQHGAGTEARLLLGRAYLQLGRADAALDEAALLADAALDVELRARAQALAGRALFGLQRLEAAHQAFAAASLDFTAAGRTDASGRARLNACGALLRLGRTAEAQQQLAGQRGLSAELEHRRAILAALAACGSQGGSQTAAQVREQLQSGADQGLYALVEEYSLLPARLEALQ